MNPILTFCRHEPYTNPLKLTWFDIHDTSVHDADCLDTQELYKDMWGANLFRLVNASAEKIPHELFTQTQHHMSNIFSLDLKVCILGTEE